ncbi:Fe-S cluster assembly protein IscX [Leptolyngbya sp. 7M]|uniref:Fe-S cluster assembly protein IscX n=1 Tax=Leptolyngbya sp. 7M TaxID=2812896 RepID=UPI00397772F3
MEPQRDQGDPALNGVAFAQWHDVRAGRSVARRRRNGERNVAAKTFGWLEVQLIGEMLAERHPDLDPYRIGFPQLRKLVSELPGFKEEPGHPSNEKILEAIQRHWIEEREDRGGDEDED